MEKLKDYKGTTTLIKFNSLEEYELLRSLLLEVYTGYRQNHIKNLNEYDAINMMKDCFSNTNDTNFSHYEIINASEFLQQKQNYYFY